MIYFLNVCTNPDFLSVISYLKLLIDIICFIIPIALIIMSSIDVSKIVLNPDPKNSKKATSMLVKRTIAAVAVFFIPTFVSIILGLIGTVNYSLTACWSNAQKTTIQVYRAAREEEKAQEKAKIQEQRENEEKERLIYEAIREAAREENEKKAQEAAKNASSESTGVSTALAARLISIAQREADSKPGDSPNKYTRGFGSIPGYGSGGYDYPWCAAFVWWVSNEAGVYPTEVGKKTAGVGGYMSYFQNGTNGTRYERSAGHGGNYVPKMGDYIFFDWDNNPNGGDHIGLVKGISGDRVLIIDGNYSNTVKDRSMYLSSKDIIGYGVWE